MAHIEDLSILGGGIVGNFSLNLFSNELQLIVNKKKVKNALKKIAITLDKKGLAKNFPGFLPLK